MLLKPYSLNLENPKIKNRNFRAKSQSQKPKQLSLHQTNLVNKFWMHNKIFTSNNLAKKQQQQNQFSQKVFLAEKDISDKILQELKKLDHQHQQSQYPKYNSNHSPLKSEQRPDLNISPSQKKLSRLNSRISNTTERKIPKNQQNLFSTQQNPFYSPIKPQKKDQSLLNSSSLYKEFPQRVLKQSRPQTQQQSYPLQSYKSRKQRYSIQSSQKYQQNSLTSLNSFLQQFDPSQEQFQDITTTTNNNNNHNSNIRKPNTNKNGKLYKSFQNASELQRHIEESYQMEIQDPRQDRSHTYNFEKEMDKQYLVFLNKLQSKSSKKISKKYLNSPSQSPLKKKSNNPQIQIPRPSIENNILPQKSDKIQHKTDYLSNSNSDSSIKTGILVKLAKGNFNAQENQNRSKTESIQQDSQNSVQKAYEQIHLKLKSKQQQQEKQQEKQQEEEQQQDVEVLSQINYNNPSFLDSESSYYVSYNASNANSPTKKNRKVINLKQEKAQNRKKTPILQSNFLSQNKQTQNEKKLISKSLIISSSTQKRAFNSENLNLNMSKTQNISNQFNTNLVLTNSMRSHTPQQLQQTEPHITMERKYNSKESIVHQSNLLQPRKSSLNSNKLNKKNKFKHRERYYSVNTNTNSNTNNKQKQLNNIIDIPCKIYSIQDKNIEIKIQDIK